MKRHTATSFIVAALVLAGCGGGGKGDVGPTNPTSGNGNPGGATPPEQNAPTTALFQPLQGVLPYPTDVYFSGSTDGTLNIQPANALMPLQSSINQLDGFSTNAVIRTRFASPINKSSLSATNVYVAQVVIDTPTKAVIGFTRPLLFGTDFSADVASDAGVGGTILEIRPLKPLVPSSGTDTKNVGYLVVITNGITTASGAAVTADTDYANFKAALPTCASITTASLNGLCKLTGAQLQVAGQALGINPANVVLSFSFSTQSTRDTMNVLANPAITTAQPITVVNTGLTTTALTPAGVTPPLPGHANVYKGTLQVPYYSSRPTQANPTAPLTATWLGPPSALDATSRFLTRFNPRPVATETISIPVFATVPNPASGKTKPPSGWPVVIFQHGLTRNRLDAIGIADSFADAGFVVVSIDLPLHGIGGADAVATNPFYDAAHELTFNLDLVDNSSLAAGPDGKIDPSGTHFVRPQNPLVSRDNIRQGVVDLLTLSRSLASLDLDGVAGGDIDTSRIHFLGHSLGGIVGGVYLGTATMSDIATGELTNAGGGLAQTIFDTPYGPAIKAGLAQQGITEGSTLYAQFLRDVQTAVDAGDPINYIAAAAAVRPLLLLQVVGGGTLPNGSASLPDQVVVNSSTARLINAAGLTRLSLGVNPVPLNGAYVNFLFGDHGSIINPAASAATTGEMQAESLTFAGSSGATVTIGAVAPSVVQP
jgi:hypothetical protein